MMSIRPEIQQGHCRGLPQGLGKASLKVNMRTLEALVSDSDLALPRAGGVLTGCVTRRGSAGAKTNPKTKGFKAGLGRSHLMTVGRWDCRVWSKASIKCLTGGPLWWRLGGTGAACRAGTGDELPTGPTAEDEHRC